MPEVKNTFVKGLMDKDTDERLVQSGTYRDALNIKIANSENSDVGAIESVLGNLRISNIPLNEYVDDSGNVLLDPNNSTVCVGAKRYDLEDKIYWLTTSDVKDGIWEYNEKTDRISPVIVANKKTVTVTRFMQISNQQGIIVLEDPGVPSGVTVPTDNPDLLNFFANDEWANTFGTRLADGANKIITDTTNDVTITIKGQFNETLSIPIGTKIEIDPNPADGDGDGVDEEQIKIFLPYDLALNEGYLVECEIKYITGTALNFKKNRIITGINIIDGLLFFTDNHNEPKKININTFKDLSNNNFSSTTQIFGNDITEDDITVIKKSPFSAPTLSLFDTNRVNENGESLPVRLYLNQDFSNKNIGSTITTSVGGELALKTKDRLNVFSEDPESDMEIEVEVSAIKYVKSTKRTAIDLIILTYSLPTNQDQGNKWIGRLIEDDPIYQLTFPRFSYRWKYYDGEYSVMAPFSEIAFLPGNSASTQFRDLSDFKYNGKDGFNLAMTNVVRRIELNDIEVGGADVKEIEILYKTPEINSIYVINKIQRPEGDGANIATVVVDTEQIDSVVESNQILRPYDNVPRKAKAQDVTANRIIYGNYLQGYTVDKKPSFDVSFDYRNNYKSIKSNRAYTLGVVYTDKFGRQTPVISDASGTFKIPRSKSNAGTQIVTKIVSDPPYWAKRFKYYIKDTSQEYYNIAVDRVYENPTDLGFVWLSMSSNDRSKIKEESYLILKKGHNKSEAVTSNNSKFKVLAIQADPPDFIAKKYATKDYLARVVFDSNYNQRQTQETKLSGNTPVAGSDSVNISRSNDAKNVPPDRIVHLISGNFIRFERDGQYSNYYEIKVTASSVNGKDSGVGYSVKIITTKPFGNDVEFLYNDAGSQASYFRNNTSQINIELYDRQSTAGNAEFAGRFFVKLQKNQLIEKELIQSGATEDNINYITKGATRIDGKVRRNRNKLDPGYFIGAGGKAGSPSTSISIKRGGTFGKNRSINCKRCGYNKNDARAVLDKARANAFHFHIAPNDTRANNTTFYNGLVENATISFSGHSKPYTVKAIYQYTNGNRYQTSGKGAIEKFIVLDRNLEKNLPFNGQSLPDSRKQLIEVLQVSPEDTEFNTENPAIFEVEPIRGIKELDIYYETEDSYDISVHGKQQKLRYFNSFAFGNGVESNRIRDDFNALTMDKGVRASATIPQEIKAERKLNGLIWSGLINTTASVNNTNQFIAGERITKDLLPAYGAIQKLHARDTDLMVFCEDKLVKVLSDKDALYDAEGNSLALQAINLVLGAVTPVSGEYGISNNPESFASFGNRFYFADRNRGVILRHGGNGLEEISRYGMNDFFRDKLADSIINNGYILGTYDDRNNTYNITLEGVTIAYTEDTRGWTSRLSFIPENGFSLNNKYYTFKQGHIYRHAHPKAIKNRFYGVQYNSKVSFISNASPSDVKNFKTLSYEGTKDWKATMETDLQESDELLFEKKEGKYFAFVKGKEKTATTVDLKDFTVQGIGTAEEIEAVVVATEVTLTIKLEDGVGYNAADIEITQFADTELPDTVTFTIVPTAGYVVAARDFSGDNITFTDNGTADTADNTISAVYDISVSRMYLVDTTIDVELDTGFGNSQEYTTTGNWSFAPTNCFSDIPNTGQYSITGVAESLRNINIRTIKASEGFEFQSIAAVQSGTSNPDVKIYRIYNDSTSITVFERVRIQTGGGAESYNFSATATPVTVDTEVLNFFSINQRDILKVGDTRELVIFGSIGATYQIVVNDGSSNIQTETGTLKEGIEETIDIEFPENTNPVEKTYTITLTGTGVTSLSNDLTGNNVITLKQRDSEETLINFNLETKYPTGSGSGDVTYENGKKVQNVKVTDSSVTGSVSWQISGQSWMEPEEFLDTDISFASDDVAIGIAYSNLVAAKNLIGVVDGATNSSTVVLTDTVPGLKESFDAGDIVKVLGDGITNNPTTITAITDSDDGVVNAKLTLSHTTNFIDVAEIQFVRNDAYVSFDYEVVEANEAQATVNIDFDNFFFAGVDLSFAYTVPSGAFYTATVDSTLTLTGGDSLVVPSIPIQEDREIILAPNSGYEFIEPPAPSVFTITESPATTWGSEVKSLSTRLDSQGRAIIVINFEEFTLYPSANTTVTLTAAIADFNASVVVTPSVPTVATTSVAQISNVEDTTLDIVTNVTKDSSGSPILKRGIIILEDSTNSINPTITTDGIEIRNLTQTLTGSVTSRLGSYIADLNNNFNFGFDGNTVYRIRAYAENVAGVAYGTTLSITTAPTMEITLVDEGVFNRKSQALAKLKATYTNPNNHTIVDKGFIYIFVPPSEAANLTANTLTISEVGGEAFAVADNSFLANNSTSASFVDGPGLQFVTDVSFIEEDALDNILYKVGTSKVSRTQNTTNKVANSNLPMFAVGYIKTQELGYSYSDIKSISKIASNNDVTINISEPLQVINPIDDSPDASCKLYEITNNDAKYDFDNAVDDKGFNSHHRGSISVNYTECSTGKSQPVQKRLEPGQKIRVYSNTTPTSSGQTQANVVEITDTRVTGIGTLLAGTTNRVQIDITVSDSNFGLDLKEYGILASSTRTGASGNKITINSPNTLRSSAKYPVAEKLANGTLSFSYEKSITDNDFEMRLEQGKTFVLRGYAINDSGVYYSDLKLIAMAGNADTDFDGKVNNDSNNSFNDRVGGGTGNNGPSKIDIDGATDDVGFNDSPNNPDNIFL